MSKKTEAICQEMQLNRQQRYQWRHKKLGLCFRCPNPVVKQHLLWKGNVVFKKKMVSCWVHLDKDRGRYTTLRRELVRGGGIKRGQSRQRSSLR